MPNFDNDTAPQTLSDLRAIVEQDPLGRLLGSLMIGRKNYDPSAADHGRAALYCDLRAIIDYVSAVIPQRPDILQPLRELLYSLKDLDRGTVVPLLRPAKIEHRPPNSYSEELLRADAAVLMDLKQQAGVDRKSAAYMAARRLNRAGYRDRGNTITGKRVIAWRNTVKENAGTPDAAARRFAFALNSLKDLYPSEPDLAYDFYIGAMEELDVPKILRKGVT